MTDLLKHYTAGDAFFLDRENKRLRDNYESLRSALDDAIEVLLLARRKVRPERGSYMAKDEEFVGSRYHG